MRKLLSTAAATVMGVALAADACANIFQPGFAIASAAANVACTLCDETFISRLDPEQSFREIYRDFPATGLT